MKKLRLIFVLMILLLAINACTNSPAPQAFEVDGLWSLTFTVTETVKGGPTLGEKSTVDAILETRGDKFSIRDTKGSEIYSGTRTANSIQVTGSEGLATLSLNGSFSSQTSFSGTGSAVHPTKGTIKYTVEMTKK